MPVSRPYTMHPIDELPGVLFCLDRIMAIPGGLDFDPLDAGGLPELCLASDAATGLALQLAIFCRSNA